VASAMIGDALVQASRGSTPLRPGNGDLSMAPHGVYPTGQPDRWLTLAVRDDREWAALLAVLAPEMSAHDPRFATAAARRGRRAEIDTLLARWLAARNADETAAQLQRAGVCAHVSWTMQDVADDPHLRERGALVEVSAPGIEPRLAVGAPGRFSASEGVGIGRLTPTLGQDEDYVFGELLGIDSAGRADLVAREVIL
jgi:crotonobetainyl-CoA:carnitine CoA-transferase CaiB-like acyl-CoA transferase